MNDCEIVKLYWDRDPDAIGQSRQKYGNYCYAIAYNILQNREDADECVNDTWLGAWDSMPPHRPDLLSSFLGKITRRLSLNRRRSHTALKRGGGLAEVTLSELEECLPAAETVEQTVEAEELADLLDGFLRSLPETDCSLFLCRYWYCQSVTVIARRFGWGESRVKMRLLRIRQQLKTRLEEEGVSL
jgi:RNA polymerase sigma-70 factor (ECF subfamily)